MKVGSSFCLEAILVMLLSVVGIAALSFFMLGSFDAGIVRLSDLNLQSNTGYAQYLQFSYVSIALTMVFALLSASFMILYSKTKRNKYRTFGSLLVVLFIFTNFFSIALFNSVDDTIVTGTKFDFQSAGGWNGLYEGYAFSFFVLQSLMVVLGAIALALVPISNKVPTKSTLPKTVSLIFFTIGSCVIGLSILYGSVISLIAGLGLAFWGSGLTYVSAGSYVKKEVADATSLFYLSSFAKLLNQSDSTTESPYPSSARSEFTGANMTYPAKNNIGSQNLPELSQGTSSTAKNFGTTNTPANDLLRLFERKAGSKFVGTNFSYFERIIPKLIVEVLDMAQSVCIEKAENTVRIKIENPLDSAFYAEARKYPYILQSVGTPLSGALACALANSTKRAVLTRNYLISEDGKTLEFEYALIDYPENMS